ncbi:MAG TPA: TetR/AcrR family transcriptional regulator [Iamia sp.]
MDRRQRYVEVALALFLEQGFNGVSMDQLVAAAGGSKATLYRYFDSKEALFAAIIDDIAARGALADDEDWASVPLRAGLEQLVRVTCTMALADSTIELLRLALGEYPRFPDLARALYERGPGATYARLRRFLEVKREAGEIEVDDLQIAAEQLLGGVIGHQQLRTALGAGRPTDAEIDARIDAAVSTFLAVHGRTAAPTP